MTMVQPITIPRDWRVTSATLLMLFSGIIHFIIIPHHWEHAPAHGLAMGVIGAVEVVWAIIYWWKPSRRLGQLGVILAISLIALWAITRIAPAPYTNEAEEVDFPGVFTKILEGISAVALLAVVVNTASEAGTGRVMWRTVFAVMLISVLLAFGVYGLARLTQPLFPQLSPPAMDNMEDMGGL